MCAQCSLRIHGNRFVRAGRAPLVQTTWAVIIVVDHVCACVCRPSGSMKKLARERARVRHSPKWDQFQRARAQTKTAPPNTNGTRCTRAQARAPANQRKHARAKERARPTKTTFAISQRRARLSRTRLCGGVYSQRLLLLLPPPRLTAKCRLSARRRRRADAH